MSDMRKVWPKEALDAFHPLDGPFAGMWGVDLPPMPAWLTDAEFAASFADAAVLNELVAAARAFVEKVLPGETNRRYLSLRAALAAFDAVMLPDRGKE